MTSNISLSPHFSLSEFTKSATARSHGIKNEPAPEHVENLKALCVHTLEPLREALRLPVVITSGFRTKALNSKLAHSSDRSQHMLGEAADFYVGQPQVSGSKCQVSGSKCQVSGSKCQVSGQNRRELLIKAFRTIILDESIVFDQLIIYPNFIHVSYTTHRKNRNKLIQGFGNGKYHALTRAEALMLE